MPDTESRFSPRSRASTSASWAVLALVTLASPITCRVEDGGLGGEAPMLATPSDPQRPPSIEGIGGEGGGGAGGGGEAEEADGATPTWC